MEWRHFVTYLSNDPRIYTTDLSPSNYITTIHIVSINVTEMSDMSHVSTITSILCALCNILHIVCIV